ncbi:hypothetical protein CRG98_012424 [Punica granatum]|uniref:Integrase catalytic domain-containing protein n=1 Tax=Punica granatum TaxID=22663 RepID=A0A2I0KF90_PUNGR|nr:hypothetical protein CRG98_012424 [Punica granatum]
MAAPWPFSMWGIDVIGPINPKASNGHMFILVAIDYFTKWIEAITLASVTANAVARLRVRLYCFSDSASRTPRPSLLLFGLRVQDSASVFTAFRTPRPSLLLFGLRVQDSASLFTAFQTPRPSLLLFELRVQDSVSIFTAFRTPRPGLRVHLYSFSDSASRTPCPAHALPQLTRIFPRQLTHGRNLQLLAEPATPPAHPGTPSSKYPKPRCPSARPILPKTPAHSFSSRLSLSSRPVRLLPELDSPRLPQLDRTPEFLPALSPPSVFFG